MKSFMASPSTVERKWYVVDAEGKTLGRLASEVANVLRGKNKPTYTPHIDTGDYVIVVNAEKIQVTGKKLDQKIYYHHSEYVGGMKEATLREMMQIGGTRDKNRLDFRTAGKKGRFPCFCQTLRNLLQRLIPFCPLLYEGQYNRRGRRQFSRFKSI